MDTWLRRLSIAVVVWLSVMMAVLVMNTLLEEAPLTDIWEDIILVTVLVVVGVASDFLFQRLRYPRDEE